MATNNFKAFALDPNANVMSQEEWEALPALLSGFTAGKASSAQVNKAIRQASYISACLAQYLCDSTGEDILDDGDMPGFIENLKTGISGRLIARRVFTTSQTYTPSAGTRKIIIEATGGGGGGGGAPVTTSGQSSVGGGGASGDYVQSPLLDVQPFIITIGAAGTGSDGLSIATAGGATIVGSIISVKGGASGGNGTATTSNQISGTAANSTGNLVYPPGSVVVTGGVGARGMVTFAGSQQGTLGGSGGDSPLGSGAPGQTTANNAFSVEAGMFGAGGAGAANFGASGTKKGGNGAPGVVIIWEYA